MIVLIPHRILVEWLMSQAGYPESFGITFHKQRLSGVIEEMSHTGVLYERGGAWDWALLIAIWPGLLASCALVIWLVRRDRRLEALEERAQ